MNAASSGKIAIVTGAAHGIGRAMTLGLLGAGHRVMANDVEEASLAALTADAGDAKAQLKTIAADVGRDESAGRIVAATREAFGGLDILINNAGVGPNTVRQGAKPTADFRQVEPQDFRRILEVNTIAPFLMTRAAVGPMLEQRWGRIINVTTSLDSIWRKGMLP